MPEEADLHEVLITLTEPLPLEIDAGVDFALKVVVSCPAKCDLKGDNIKITIIGQEIVTTKEVELTKFDGTSTTTDDFMLTAPTKPGNYTWVAVHQASEKDGIWHEGSSENFSFAVKPHMTSTAVWDIPSPVTMNQLFKIKVGIKCSTGCSLTGQSVEVYDEKGRKLATEKLGKLPWPKSQGLYWSEVGIMAPATEELHTMKVRFPVPGMELPHEEISANFYFKTARPPEHTVTIEVIDRQTMNPLSDASVLLGLRRVSTDRNGTARIEVPKGKHELYVSKQDYENFHKAIDAHNDITIKVELSFLPEFSG